MALPMVHLLAARDWAQGRPELANDPDYYLGAISPDAIHIRDGGDKSHKNFIHLNNWLTPHPEEVLSYWRTHHTPFDIGYGVHVLTDCQWVERFHQRLKGMLLPSGRPDTKIYYNDTCVTDFALYAESPDTPRLMEMLRRGCAPTDHPLLSAHEISAWRDTTIDFYRKPCPMNGEVRFVTRAYVEEFLNDCGKLLDETYGRYQKMMNDTQKSILNRRSTRGFSGEQLTNDELQNLIDAALSAPSARNAQDWHFSFVQDASLLARFSADYVEIACAALDAEKTEKFRNSGAGDPLFFHAPTVVMITLPENPASRFAQVDAGIACENIVLSATGMGLGSVIVGRPMDVFDSEKGAAYARAFGFPEGHRFAIGVAIGHNTVTKEAHPTNGEKVCLIRG